MKKLKATLATHDPEDGAANATVKWYLDNGYGQMTTTYNQYAASVMDPLDLYVCVLDTNFTARNYSTTYKRLTAFNPAWVGLYPSTYQWEVKLDMEGNTDTITIKDVEQLQKIPSLKPAEKFWFAGVQYNASKVQLKNESDLSWGYDFIAEDKKKTQEGIYIRKVLDAYFIVNYALNTNKERQTYGSSGNVCEVLRNYVKKTFLNEDYGESTFWQENENCDVTDW